MNNNPTNKGSSKKYKYLSGVKKMSLENYTVSQEFKALLEESLREKNEELKKLQKEQKWKNRRENVFLLSALCGVISLIVTILVNIKSLKDFISSVLGK